VGEHQQAVARGQEDEAGSRRPLAQTVEGPQDPRIQGRGVKLGEGIAPNIDVHQVKRGIGVGGGGEQRPHAARADPPGQEVHHPAGQEKAQRLGELDPPQHAAAGAAQQGGQVIGEGRIVIKESVTEAVGGIGHPMGGQDAGREVAFQLLHSLEQKGGIAAGAGVHDPRTDQEGQGGRQRQEQRQEEAWIHPPGAHVISPA